MPGYSSIESPAGPRVERCQLHGVLVHVFGSGVLISGESGVGKTEIAIELLRRGHTFVSDDAVQIFQRGADIFGTAPEITRSLVAVRGVGIANVTDVFHRAALLTECRIDINVEIRDSGDIYPAPQLGVPHFRIEPAPPAVLADRIESITRENVGY